MRDGVWARRKPHPRGRDTRGRAERARIAPPSLSHTGAIYIGPALKAKGTKALRPVIHQRRSCTGRHADRAGPTTVGARASGAAMPQPTPATPGTFQTGNRPRVGIALEWGVSSELVITISKRAPQRRQFNSLLAFISRSVCAGPQPPVPHDEVRTSLG